MSLISGEGEVTARGVLPVMQCANPDCRERILQMSFFGQGIVRLLIPCPACGCFSEFESTPMGVTVRCQKSRAPTPKKRT